MTYHPVFRDGQLHVLADRCKTCIFRPGNLMHLQPGRVKSMVDGAIANESVIPCHSTIYRSDVDPAVCRGYWDAYRDQVQALQLAERLRLVVEDQPPASDH